MKFIAIPVALVTFSLSYAGCSSSSSPSGGIDASFEVSTVDTSLEIDTSVELDSAADSATAVDANDAGKIIADGLIDPIPYKSFADSPFNGVKFSYFHLEDWEDGALNVPGVTASSTTLSSSYGGALVDSVDGDDGIVDGKCSKDGGKCETVFANGTNSFTFDAAALGGNLPSHVGAVWTDGSTGCDAIFEAYDANDKLIGSRTVKTIGDSTNNDSVNEDRFFGVVASAGIKKIVVKSSAGGVEVDHLQFGR